MLKDFNAVKITVASPQDILNWSHGEVTKAETINYRTFRSEPQGLMAEEIFGPTKDFECYCGKYKGVRYKGIVCDRCGVEVTHKRVRRERMGHIKLAAPVTHLWFANGVPNKLAMILDIPQKKLQTVIYYARYVVTEVNEEEQKLALESLPELKVEELKELEVEEKEKLAEVSDEFEDLRDDANKENKDKAKLKLQLERINNNEQKEVARVKSAFKQRVDNSDKKFGELKTLINSVKVGFTLSEEEHALMEDYDFFFYEAGMGAEAMQMLLEGLNVDETILELEEVRMTTKSQLKKSKAIQRLRVLKGIRSSGISPEWLVLEVLPVIPPDLRPIIQLPGGRFATYDLNDLYRRVINRNNRLKRLINLGAPEIILRNEKRMMQQSVDALMDNNHMPSAPALNTRGMPFKSLSDMLRGKQGRFRQNLLGKRVDYSGRAVIVAGPELKFDQCGLPKNVALELFKPFVIRELISRGHAANPSRAKIIFDQKQEMVWDILEEVSKDRPVLLNRAPSLHRYSILAFYPTLIEGNAIRLHPMVVAGFNADFDGDQMAVHLPLSEKAVKEVKERMFAKDNMIHMRNSEPIVNVSKDMAMGIYYLTLMKEVEGGTKELPRFTFSTFDMALAAYEMGTVTFYEPIKFLMNGEILTTTVGRLIFNNILPEEYDFINEELDKKGIAKVSSDIFNTYGGEKATNVLDDVKDLGFRFAGELGWSVSAGEFRFGGNELAKEAIAEFDKLEDELYENYEEGMMTDRELQVKRMETWNKKTEEVYSKIWDLAEAHKGTSNLVELEYSGGVPVKSWVKQISGMRGSVTNMDGQYVNLPLKGNYETGLNNFEYFASSKAVRKSMADVALKTANSGYLTRRLVDVAQDLVVKIDDCDTSKGLEIRKDDEQNPRAFEDRIKARFTAKPVVDVKTGEVLYERGTEITLEVAAELASNENVEAVDVRSPLKCNVPHGVCTKCYGYDNTTRKPVEIGEAIGIAAAQALGEPTTQLTLKSKSDARAGGADVTQGLPRVEELLEARTPKGMAILAELDGQVTIVEERKKNYIRVTAEEAEVKKYDLEETDEVMVKDGAKVKSREVLVVKSDKTEVRSPLSGKVTIDKENKQLLIEALKVKEVEYKLPNIGDLLVQDGDMVTRGQQLTFGSSDPKQLAEYLNTEVAARYIVDNVQSVYAIQGLDVDDRHLEVISRQMTRYALVTENGASENFLPGDYGDTLELTKENYVLEDAGKHGIRFNPVALGVTNAAIRTESFLSAASFEQQVRVLTEAALVGKVDHLRGLKENVIIGRPVPIGKELIENNLEEVEAVRSAVEILKKVEDKN